MKNRDNGFKLLVFDWDGTLSDSESRIIVAMQSAIRKLELPQRQDNEIRDIIGLGLDEAVYRLYPDILPEQRMDLANQYRSDYLAITVEPTPLFPDAIRTIKVLHDAGYLLAVATGKSRRGLNRSLGEHNLGRYFHATRCADETVSKPHPQMLKEIMLSLDVLPGNTLLIGDSEYDMQMAINAAVACVAVSYGVHKPVRLLESGALACFDTLADLPAWLEQYATDQGQSQNNHTNGYFNESGYF